jgi:alpha-D-xyloside xylohydrolase
MSVFSSHMRLHGLGPREPWVFGEDAERIARQWIEFRYRLLPYLKSVIAQSTAAGLPVMRAMPLAFPNNALTRAYETQFMCGDAVLVAPIVAAGGEVDVALPPGAWYDLASRQRLAGRQVIRYRATLERFPVFGREGYALPLGPVVQHTGEIDPAAPLAALYLFGKPTQVLEGFEQAKIALADGGATVAVAATVDVEIFGDSAGIRIERPQ